MRFELTQTEIGAENTISDTLYSVNISLYIKDTEGLIPNFVKVIEVVSSNDLTGFEVDAQRQTEIDNTLTELNQ